MPHYKTLSALEILIRRGIIITRIKPGGHIRSLPAEIYENQYAIKVLSS